MNWSDEDPELLRAALEIIESWDGESSVNGVAITSPPTATEDADSDNGEAGSEDSSELATSPAATNTTDETNGGTKLPPRSLAIAARTNERAAPRELKRSTISSTRHKRRKEILYLRDKISTMETQLATLQKQKVDGGSSVTSEANGLNTALEVTWQDIASRQQRLRQKAELEQAKLRGLLETQMKVASGLIKLIQKARHIEDDESFPTANRAKLPISVSDGVSEEEQCAHVDELYNRMDEALSFAKFHDGTVKFVDVEVDDEGDDVVVIEFRDAWALPFEIDEVMDAIWEFMGKCVEPKRCQEDARKAIAVGSDMFTMYLSGSEAVGELTGAFNGEVSPSDFPRLGTETPPSLRACFAGPVAVKRANSEAFGSMKMHSFVSFRLKRSQDNQTAAYCRSYSRAAVAD